ncbi:hypothetical protein LINGRAHAP2_LOCUS29590 [Linum grandiflorum]
MSDSAPLHSASSPSLSPTVPVAPELGSGAKTWASLIAPSAELKTIELTPECFLDGALKIPPEILARGAHRMNAALVAQFLGPIPPMRVFAAMANRLWAFECDITIYVLLDGFFLLEFPSKSLCD